MHFASVLYALFAQTRPVCAGRRLGWNVWSPAPRAMLSKCMYRTPTSFFGIVDLFGVVGYCLQRSCDGFHWALC